MKTYQISIDDKDSELFLQILQSLKFITHIQETDHSSQSGIHKDEDGWNQQDWQEFEQELSDRRKRFSSFNVDDL